MRIAPLNSAGFPSVPEMTVHNGSAPTGTEKRLLVSFPRGVEIEMTPEEFAAIEFGIKLAGPSDSDGRLA